MWIILVILNMVLVQVLVSMESFEHNEHVIVHTISFPANLKFLTDFFYMLHNGNTMVTQCYTMVHVTQWYMLHNGTCYTMVYVTLPLCFIQPHDVIQNNRKNDASYKKIVLKLKK